MYSHFYKSKHAIIIFSWSQQIAFPKYTTIEKGWPENETYFSHFINFLQFPPFLKCLPCIWKLELRKLDMPGDLF